MRRENLLKRVVSFLMIMTVLWCTLNLPARADFNPAVTMTSEVGVHGYFKAQDMARVNLQITNRGKEFEATINFTSPKNGQMRFGGERIHAPAGESVSKVLQVPGEYFIDGGNALLIVNGEIVAEALVAGKQITGLGIATLGSKNLFSFFNQPALTDDSRPKTVFSVTPEELTEVIHQGVADMIILNAAADSQTLTAHQAAAVRTWVEMGGILLVGAAPGQEAKLAEFKPLLPLQADGMTEVNLSTLNQLAKDSLPAGQLAVTNSHLNGGQVLLAEQNLPVLAVKRAGKGHVFQAAFDLDNNLLRDWKGNAAFWERVLFLGGAATGQLYVKGNPIDGLQQASRYLPQFKYPTIWTTVILLLLYALVVGPVTYLILKRKDKREWGWAVIPLLAVVVTGSIIGVGYMIRGNGAINQATGVIDISSGALSRVESSHSFVVPSGGDYTIEALSDSLIKPEGANSWIHGERQGSRPIFQFEKIDYLTTKSANLKGILRDTGMIAGELSMDGAMLTGTLTNNTKFPLKDVRLAIGSKVLMLPDLQVGATQDVRVNVNESLKANVWAPNRRIQQEFLPVDVDKDRMNQRYYRILEYALGREFLENGTVTIFGWTEQPTEMLTVKNQNNNRGALYLVRQQMNVRFMAGKSIILPSEMLSARVVNHSGIRNMQSLYNPYTLGKGSVTYETDIKPDASLKIKKINIHMDGQNLADMDVHIFNWKSSEWEVVADGKRTIEAAQLENYLLNEKFLQIRYTNKSSKDIPVAEPVLVVEGEVTT